MSEATGVDALKSQMDPANLYREDVVTDRKVGTIRMLTPITPEGDRDTTRPMLFAGDAQIMTQMGPLPLSFDIPGETLAEAVANYGEAAKEGLRKTIERIEEMRREAAHQIVTPGMPGYQAPPAAGGSGIVMP